MVSTWGNVKNLGNVSLDVDVKVDDTRAFMIDEGVTEKTQGYKPFVYKGTINLYNSKNVGLDLQGTHTQYESGISINSEYTNMSQIANIKVTNAGNINGISTGNQKNQVGMGFNNHDRSSNNTRTEMYNSGIISMNADESAGIQIRPENSGYSDSNGFKRGLNMMAGINNKIINIEGESSFGILSMKNPDATFTYTYNFTSANTGTQSSAISTVVPAGGVTASYAHKDFESKLEQTSSGEININGNKSIGIGLLNSIQGAYVAGKINIASTSSATEAVGVYSEVAMKPVKDGEVDDFGILNQTGGIIGSDSVEVTGKINIDGSKAVKATGARIKDLGKITIKSGGEINIEAGNNVNYGIVSEGISGTRVSKKAASPGAVLTTKNENIFGSVDIENGGSVNIKGSNSIGYVLLKGNGSNDGNITVTDTGNKSLGFYGVSGVFSNTSNGKIETTGTNNNAVYLKEDTTTGTLKFTNTGNIIANTEGTVGVYIEKANEFNHNGGVIKAGNGAAGITFLQL
jgi:fusobacterium outer membrane protein